ncbi:hypothetical protein [Streptomyces sp. NPDC050355]|uniref:hypothetical protein n=1 Tax=Streptomyces sp. NPDC050355 TaxID=3365609 RepID=UPI0037A10C0E
MGALLARTVRGDWISAAKVAAGPTLLLLVLASVLAMFSSDNAHSGGLGWGVRMRIALALLLQSVGGGVTLAGDAGASLGPFGEGLSGEATLSLVPLVVTMAWAGLLAAGARRFAAVRPSGAAGAPLTGPAADARTAVPETVLRVAALCGAGTFALGLLAQPSYSGVELSSAPFLTLLWSFLLAAAVCGVTVGRGEAGAWLAARPGRRIALGALRTALLALLAVVLLAGVVAVVVLLTNAKDLDGGGVVAALVLLPNIGALALAMAWGAPVNAEWNLPAIPFLDSGRQSLGYGELSHLGGGWVLFGVLAGALAGALLVGFLVVRRSADRREQLLSAGFFVVSLVLLVLVAGASVSATFRAGGGDGYGYGDGYGSGYGGGYGSGYGGRLAGAHGELAAGGAETLLFALLWTFGAVLVVPYLLRMVGRGGGPTAPVPGSYGAAPAAPYAAPGAAAPGAPMAAAPVAPAEATPATAHPAAPAAPVPSAPAPAAPNPAPPTPTAPDLPLVRSGQEPVPEPSKPRRRVLKWLALALAAFLVGGGATAGALYFSNHRGGDNRSADGGDDKKADKPAPVKSAPPTPGPSATPTSPSSPGATASGEPTGTPTDGPTAGLPDGFVQKYDPNGFSIAVRHDWKREPKGTQTDYKAPVGKQYLRIGVIANAPQSSYDNFLTMEKGAKKRLNYQRTELKRNTFQDSPGARWEFTYVNDTGNTVHAVDQAYLAADGTEYSIYYECLEAQYDPEADKVFSTALATWSVSDADVD